MYTYIKRTGSHVLCFTDMQFLKNSFIFGLLAILSMHCASSRNMYISRLALAAPDASAGPPDLVEEHCQTMSPPPESVLVENLRREAGAELARIRFYYKSGIVAVIPLPPFPIVAWNCLTVTAKVRPAPSD